MEASSKSYPIVPVDASKAFLSSGEEEEKKAAFSWAGIISESAAAAALAICLLLLCFRFGAGSFLRGFRSVPFFDWSS